MSTYEELMIILATASLIVSIISMKKKVAALSPEKISDYFLFT